MQQFFKLSNRNFFSETCLCHNYQLTQQFVNFHKELFPEACLCNNFQFMQQFFNFHIGNSFQGLLMQQSPAYATIF